MPFIERITMRNFKSFRSCTIPFSRHFNAIMGPNGSGKSNIIDAIVFVLGEGRLKIIRANRLQDLVHHKARDGEAVVSIDLVEGDKKYTISRSIDKKGRSVYRINGKRATRHEVVSLLSTLGVSSEGHNIILQGEVARIIKMSPVERRQIIDEVAGISEYEEKKKEALDELEEVNVKIKEANLVLGEKKAYLEKLDSERRAALEYLDLRKKLRALRRTLLEKKVKEAEISKERIESELEKVDDELNKCKEELKELSEEKNKLEEEINALEAKLMEILSASGEGKAESLKNEISVKRARIEAIEEEKERIEREILELLSKKSDLENSLVFLRKEVESVRQKYETKSKELENARAELEGILKAVEEKERGLSEIEKRIMEISEEIDRKKEEFAKAREEHGKLVGEYNAKREIIGEDLEEELKRLEKERKKLVDEKNALFEREKELNRKYIGLSEEIKTLKERIGSYKGAMSALKSMGVGVDVLEHLMAAQRAGELFGIHGFVAGLIKYDKKYEKAIEAAAGRRLFYIVTDTVDAATEAIKYLKRKGLGRATFAPLDKVVPKNTDVPEGALGRLVDFIDYDEKYARVVKYVFGDTILVKDIDGAKKLVGKYRVVTLDGDLAERTGIMTGGTAQRARALELMHVEELRSELSEKEGEMKDILNELHSIREKIQNISSEIARIESKMKDIEKKVNVVEEYKAIEKKISELEEKMRQLAGEISDLEMKKAELYKKLRSEKEESAVKDISSVRERVRLLSEEAEELRKALEERERELAVKEADAKNIEERVKSFEERKTELNQEKENVEKELRVLEEELERIEGELEGKKKEIEELKVAKREKEEELRKVLEKIGSIEAHERELDKKKIELKAKFENVVFALSELKVEIEEYSDAEVLDSLPENPEKEIEFLAEKMRALEPVNLRAIDEYEEWKREVEEVEVKIRKLEEEKEAIYRMIAEIERKKEKAFMDTFREVSKKFSEVFIDMAQGEAKLKLTNEENIFESGLLIEAKPRGKELRNIEAMSGGEKALVALAFIFAIAMCKPSGFYILDEPDLMLDKPNSEKMAKYVKKLSKNVQFIVISHRDPVLKEADQIIGVYMRGDGSSAVEIKN